MSTDKKVEQLIVHLENYVACWKQFNQFANLARARKFSAQDEEQFLEVKTLLAQELELILSSMDVPSPNRAEIHDLVGRAPSLRFLSEANEGVVRSLETEWHRIFIALHAILGQLKVRLHAKPA